MPSAEQSGHLPCGGMMHCPEQEAGNPWQMSQSCHIATEPGISFFGQVWYNFKL